MNVKETLLKTITDFAEKLYPVKSWPGSRKHSTRRHKHDAFIEGAEFGVSIKEIQMKKFAEWSQKKASYSPQDKIWYMCIDGKDVVRLNTTELLDLYYEEMEKKG